MHKLTRSALTGAAALFLATGLAVACDTNRAQAACAATAIETKSSGATKSGGAASASKTASPPKAATGGKSGGASSGVDRSKSPDPPAYKPPAPGAKVKPEQKPPPPKPTKPRSDAEVDRAKKSASATKVKPDPADVNEARDEAPNHVTRGGTYVSNITHNTYVYHDRDYYSRRGFRMDIWDPYDPYNYWYRPLSPYYHRPYIVAADCDEKDEEIEQPVNVNVTVDNDGVVTGTVPATPDASTTIPQTPGTVIVTVTVQVPATEAPTTTTTVPS